MNIQSSEILINEVLPHAISMLSKKNRLRSTDIRDVSIVLDKEGNISCVYSYNSFCQYRKCSPIKTFRASKHLGFEWKFQGEIDCCGFDRLYDIDLPLNWKDKMVAKIEYTYAKASS